MMVAVFLIHVCVMLACLSTVQLVYDFVNCNAFCNVCMTHTFL